jgi:hypothetical protein
MTEFIGYHATDAYGARKTEEEGFRDSPSDSWLGPGVYFFESRLPEFDGMKAAEWWGKSYKRYKDLIILGAKIESDSVFDLFESETDRQRFGKLKRKFLEKHCSENRIEQDFNINVVFLFLGKKYEVIRCLVDASRVDQFRNYVVGYPQIQLCVVKNQCIGKPVKVQGS